MILNVIVCIILILAIIWISKMVYDNMQKGGIGWGLGWKDTNNNTNNDTNKNTNVENFGASVNLNNGTYENKYPRGECKIGDLTKRSDCEVGNCNLGSMISDNQFCQIDCAQESDERERQECQNICLESLKYC